MGKYLVGTIAAPRTRLALAFYSTLGVGFFALIASCLISRLACDMPEGTSHWINVGLVFPHVVSSSMSSHSSKGQYAPVGSSRRVELHDAILDSVAPDIASE